MVRTILLIGLLIMILVGNEQSSLAQGDTLNYRKMQLRINDSVFIDYVLGGFVLKQSSSYSTLNFASNAADSNSGNYLKSVGFTSLGSSDTVLLDAMVGFNDFLTRTDVSGLDALTQAQEDTFWVHLANDLANKEVYPSSSQFSSTSSLKFIIDVREVGSNALLGTLDTAKLELNVSGALRYRNTNNTPTKWRYPLPAGANAHTVYIIVRPLVALPSGASISYKTSQIPRGLVDPNNQVECAFRQAGCTGEHIYGGAPASPKLAWQDLSANALAKVFPPSPNPTTGDVEFQVQLNRAGRIAWRLTDLLGDEVASAFADCASGITPIRVPHLQLRNGSYFLTVWDRDFKQTLRVNIIH